MARVCMIGFTQYRTDPRVRREAEALVQRGDSVDVICIRAVERDGRRSVDGVRLYEVWTPRYRGSNLLMYLAQYFVFFLVASLRSAWLHSKERYDVVEVHTMPDFFVFTAAIPKLFGAKVLLDIHDLSPELYQSKFGLARSHWFIRLLRWIERRSVSFADQAIAVHEPHLEVLTRHGNPKEKFEVLLNVADPRRFAPRTTEPDADAPFKLVYHGTVAPRHGLDVAVRAVNLARREIDRMEFAIIGVGDDVPRIERLVAELGLEDVVRLSSKAVPIEDLVPFLEDAHVGVVPIHYDDFTRYMLPVKLLEYVALGIPVACSDTETIRAYFDDGMLAFFRPGDECDLAARLVELYRHPELRRALAKRAHSFNERFSWDSQKVTYYGSIDSLTRRSDS
jgi:glycosyltransferase involved in cell wall biosynthesis